MLWWSKLLPTKANASLNQLAHKVLSFPACCVNSYRSIASLAKESLQAHLAYLEGLLHREHLGPHSVNALFHTQSKCYGSNINRSPPEFIIANKNPNKWLGWKKWKDFLYISDVVEVQQRSLLQGKETIMTVLLHRTVQQRPILHTAWLTLPRKVKWVDSN